MLTMCKLKFSKKYTHVIGECSSLFYSKAITRLNFLELFINHKKCTGSIKKMLIHIELCEKKTLRCIHLF